MYFLFSKAGNFETSIIRVPYNKLLTNLACSSRTGEYWPSVVFVRTSLRSVRTATTSGQYSPVRPSRSVSKRLLLAGWEVRRVKNCDRGLENAARGRRPKAAFQARGHSFSLYGPTLSRQITYLFFFLRYIGLQVGLFTQLCH